MTTDTFERQSNMLDERIRALFEGNTPEGTAIELKSRHACAESLRARVNLSIGWKSNGASLVGAITPENSIWCSTRDELNTKLTAQLNAQIANQDELNAVRQNWANDSNGLLIWEKPDFIFRRIDNQWHCHERCENCNGCGEVRCNCFFGRRQCTNCTGGKVTVYVQKQYHSVAVQTNCTWCGGVGTVICQTCGGRSWVGCNSCSTTGYFTIVYSAEITANVQKAITCFESTEAPFVRSVESMPLATTAVQGCVDFLDSGIHGSDVSFDYRLTLPYLRHTYVVGPKEFVIHGVGSGALVPHMPNILDDYIRPVTDQVLNEANGHEYVLRSADGSSVTRTILWAIGAKDPVSAGDIATRFDNAISVELVDGLIKSINTAYHGHTLPAVKALWIKATVALNVVVLLALTTGLLGAIARAMKPDAPVEVWHFLLFVLPVVTLSVVWLIARQTSLNAMRRLVGQHIVRAPSQGWFPIASGVVSLCFAYLLFQADSRWTARHSQLAQSAPQSLQAPASSLRPLTRSAR
ncbi:hypothetical protein [Bradyrhizobium sp. 76]|uniref:hypothetical protein n=1 Tax=Bradyrhizobium sp. 76 TaxID=2782680 RepID=UPI001FF9168D|nr:hypothetical protein [Bradyrhizobium sp. 76]MCK1407709.1 hypothetical protein [Bradyrhizobium sp. 76]